MKKIKFFDEQPRRSVDLYKIRFHCFKLPEAESQLIGFEANKLYTGRYYNDLYEISVDWGRSRPFLIEKRKFEKYFQLIDKKDSFGT